MKSLLRIPRPLDEAARTDLARPHPYAAERVGFFSARLGNKEGDVHIVLLSEYHPIKDEDYVDDPKSGARIDSDSIRVVMQRIMDTGNGAFHTHMHPHRGVPGLSHMDRREIPRLVSSFRVVGPLVPHGILLFSEDKCTSYIWLPNSRDPISPSKISVVGFPMGLIWGERAWR